MGDQLLQTLIYKEVTTVCTFLFDLGKFLSQMPVLILHWGVCVSLSGGSVNYYTMEFANLKNLGPLFFFLLNLEQRNPYLIQIYGFDLKVKSS